MKKTLILTTSLVSLILAATAAYGLKAISSQSDKGIIIHNVAKNQQAMQKQINEMQATLNEVHSLIKQNQANQKIIIHRLEKAPNVTIPGKMYKK